MAELTVETEIQAHTQVTHSWTTATRCPWTVNRMQWSHDAFEYLKNEVHSIGFGHKSLVNDVVVDG